AHPGQPPQAADGLLERGLATTRVEAEHRRLVDARVVATLFLAVPLEHVELVRDFGRRKQVARVCVARDQAQRLLLAAAADQDRWMRSTQTLRRVERSRQAVVRAADGCLVALPHLQADAERL